VPVVGAKVPRGKIDCLHILRQEMARTGSVCSDSSFWRTRAGSNWIGSSNVPGTVEVEG
jgi:hypothetical protein